MVAGLTLVAERNRALWCDASLFLIAFARSSGFYFTCGQLIVMVDIYLCETKLDHHAKAVYKSDFLHNGYD